MSSRDGENGKHDSVIDPVIIGKNLMAAGLTIDEIKDLLRDGDISAGLPVKIYLKLFPNSENEL